LPFGKSNAYGKSLSKRNGLANFYFAESQITIEDEVSFELKLAWKYFRARRRSLARFTSVAAVVGIAAGVAAMIVAQSLTRGFADEMRDKILANTAHITIFRRDGGQILNWEDVRANLNDLENVREISPTTYESALIVGLKSTTYCVLRAIAESESQASAKAAVFSAKRPSQISNFKFQTQKQSEISNLKSEVADEQAHENQKPKTENRPIEILIGAELAEKTGLKVGDEAEIIFPNGELAPQTSRVIVGEIFRAGIFDYDATWVYVSFEDLAQLAGQTNFAPTVLSVTLEDIYAADKTAAAISAKLGEDFKTLDWQAANQPLFAALSLERKLALAIISLIIFVAALNITTTLALLVNERRLDIAVLRTCGARRRSLILIFLLEGLFLGAAGIFAGLIAGLTLCAAGNYFEIVSLASEIYSLSYIPLRPRIADVLLIAAAAFVLSLAATVYPALRAAAVKPLENLRNR
jgi:lipoprotein-releasing system permease protein